MYFLIKFMLIKNFRVIESNFETFFKKFQIIIKKLLKNHKFSRSKTKKIF